MEFTEYQIEANKTIPDGMKESEIIDNAVYGVIGEVGELVDIIKKAKFQGHILDREHAKLELGDILWYVSEMAFGLGITLEDVAWANIKKLRARYGEKFDPQKSQNRKEGDI